MLGLRRKVHVAGKEVAHDGEMMRLQLLGNRDILNQMKQVCRTCSKGNVPNMIPTGTA